MRYINYEKILTPEEISSLEKTNVMLAGFIRRVPLRRDRNSPVQLTNMTIATLSNHTLFESFAILKRIYLNRRKTRSAFDVFWSQIIKDVSSASLDDLIALAMTIEPFAANLEALLTGVYPTGKVFQSFFSEFRPKDPAYPKRNTTIFPSIAGRNTTILCHNVRHLRNKVGHGHDDLPAESGRLMILTNFICLCNRFDTEIIERLFNEDDFIEYESESIRDDSVLMEWADKYMKQCFDDAGSEIKKDIKDGSLPVLKVQPALSFSSGVTYLTGIRGSGKTTWLRQLAVSASLCQYAILATRESLYSRYHNTRWLISMIAGDSINSCSPRQIEALNIWVEDNLHRRNIALLIDTDEPPAKWQQALISETGKLIPELMILIACLPFDRSENGAVPAEFREVRLQSLSSGARSAVMRLYGTAGKEFEISHLLHKVAGVFADRLDLSHPATLCTFLDQVSASLTLPRLNETELLTAISGLTGQMSETAAHLKQDFDSVTDLAAETDAALYGSAGYDNPDTILAGSRWLQPDRLTTLFEICQKLSGNQKVCALSTLAVRHLLSSARARMAEGTEPDAPLPILHVLAQAVCHLTVTPPQQQNKNILYRPSPAFIAERLILNLLVTYPIPADAENYDNLAITNIIRAALSLGTPEIMTLLFSRKWAPVWTSQRFYRKSSSFIAKPFELFQRTVAYINSQALLGCLDSIRHFPFLLFRILTKMNDAQRIECIDWIRETQADLLMMPVDMPMLLNLVVMSMECPTAVRLYDTSNYFLSDIIWDQVSKTIDHGEWGHKLMVKIAFHAVNLSHKKILQSVLSMLVTDEYYSDEAFTHLVRTITDSPDLAEIAVSALADTPLHSLSRQVSLRLFNPTLTDLTLSNPLNPKTLPPVHYRIFKGPRAVMLRPTSDIKKASYSYCAYSLSDDEAILSVEAFETNTNLNGLSIFLGNDITARISRISTPSSGSYAHLTVRLDRVPMSIPQSGKIVVSQDDGPAIEARYLAAFHEPDSTAVIVRTESTDITSLTRDTATGGWKARMCGVNGCVTDIDVIPFDGATTFMVIKPYARKSFGTDIPHTGVFTVRKAIARGDMDRSHPVTLALRSKLSRITREPVPDFYSAGYISDCLLLAHAGMPFPVGTLLLHSPSRTLFRVEQSHALTSRNERSPKEIAGKIYLTVKAIKAKGDKPPFFTAAAEVRLYRTDPAAPLINAEAGAKFPGSEIQLKWADRVFIPRIPEACESGDIAGHTYLCSTIPALPVRTYDGRPALRCPTLPDMTRVRFITVSGLPFVFSVAVCDDCLVPDSRLHGMITDRISGHERGEPFFIELYDTSREQITFTLSDISQLVTAAESQRRISADSIKFLTESMQDDRALTLAAFHIFLRMGRISQWLHHMTTSRWLDKKICSGFPLATVTEVDQSRKSYTVLLPDSDTSMQIRYMGSPDIREGDLQWYDRTSGKCYRLTRITIDVIRRILTK